MRRIITIKCKINNLFNPFYYILLVYNKGQLIYRIKVNSYNCIKLKLFKNKIYNIVVIPCEEVFPNSLYLNILLNRCYFNSFLFEFKKQYINPKSCIDINLTDYFYKGLPIEKGEVIFWKNLI